MSEKIIHEIRVIETEDGFRVEMKGDKEQLREVVNMLTGEGPRHFGKGKHGGKGWGWKMKRGPWFMRRFGMWGQPHQHGPQHHEHHGPHFERGVHHHGMPPQPPAGPGYDLGPWFDEGDAPDQDGPRRI